MTEVFSRIVQYHQYDAYDKFEEISTLVKRTHMNFSDPMQDGALNASSSKTDVETFKDKQWVKTSQELLNEVHRDMAKQSVKSIKARVPNLDEESDMLEWAGVSFG